MNDFLQNWRIFSKKPKNSYNYCKITKISEISEISKKKNKTYTFHKIKKHTTLPPDLGLLLKRKAFMKPQVLLVFTNLPHQNFVAHTMWNELHSYVVVSTCQLPHLTENSKPKKVSSYCEIKGYIGKIVDSCITSLSVQLKFATHFYESFQSKRLILWRVCIILKTNIDWRVTFLQLINSAHNFWFWWQGWIELG